MPLLFATTLFVSALLLFWVQPMIAKMLLPLLGGTPTVWNTCMVFFQATLLAGYAYSHFLTRRLSFRAQAAIHTVLLLVTCAALPIGLSEHAMQSAPWQSNPFVWLLQHLFLVVALPFFTVSTSGPLLQHWFSRTDHAAARDPYFLYAASNLGSLIALLGYPAAVEPMLRLGQQTNLWTWTYVALVILFIACGVATSRRLANSSAKLETLAATSTSTQSASVDPARPDWARRGRWILWAFVPSSLMLGVTSYLTTDIASVPLLWVIPLALYLLTFVVVFAKRQVLPMSAVNKYLPVAAISLTFLMLTNVKNPTWLLILLHLGFFFAAALIAHGRLAADRPSSSHLTEFYLCLSVGGVLGGLFNAMLSPVLFKTVIEYPIALVLACLVRPPLPEGERPAPRRFWADAALAVAIGGATGLMAVFVPRFSLELYQLAMVLIFGVPLIVCFLLSKSPVRFALALAAVMAGSSFYTAIRGQTLEVERNFFGALRVTMDPEGRFRNFYHGNTIHGIQFVDTGRKRDTVCYYHRTGPFGHAFLATAPTLPTNNVGVIGLGAGAMAVYAQPNQRWTYYEIDPAVVRIAQDTNFFSYLHDSTNATVDFKVGDARLRLREAQDGQYGLLICDAFSSDVPPLHLLTKEALDLYLSKLHPDGLIFFNISSRLLDFHPVLGNLAAACGLYAVSFPDGPVPIELQKEGKFASQWVVVSRHPRNLAALLQSGLWQPLPPDPRHRVWTDDYSNILAIFQWQ